MKTRSSVTALHRSLGGTRLNPIRRRVLSFAVGAMLGLIPASQAYADQCPDCNGRGSIESSCPDCGGSGISGYTTVHGQRAAYGCETCGGVRGDPSRGTGSRGTGRATRRCSTCGGSGQVASQQAQSQTRGDRRTQADDAAAEQQRARDEQRRKEQEEQQRKQAEFEQTKLTVLRSMKGIAESQLGMKGLRDAPVSDFGLKGLDAPVAEPFIDSSVVDLRFLAPDQPIKLDPNVVKGRERTTPAQPDPATFENVNYNEGFAALMRLDPDAAVPFFEQAMKERPNDPLVRNGLLLAQDLVKVRRQKEQDNRALAARWKAEAYAALANGQTGKARAFITQARELDPADTEIRSLGLIADRLALATTPDNAPAQRDAHRMLGHGLASLHQGDYRTAAEFMECARRLRPDDPFINDLARPLRGFLEERRAAGMSDPNPIHN